MDPLNELDFLADTFSFQDSLSDTTELIYDIRKAGRPLLVNQDYNLNSPLIDDETEAAIEFIKSDRLNPRFRTHQAELTAFKAALKDVYANPSRIIEPKEHHKFIPDLIYNTDAELSNINLLERWEETWELTQEPVIATQTLLLGKPPAPSKYKDRFHILKSTLPDYEPIQQEFKTFHNLNLIIHIMNISPLSPKEEWVKKSVKLIGDPSKYQNKIHILGPSKSKPTWIVSKNFSYHCKTGCFLSKNFLLMLKDISLARMMSQLALMSREDQPYCTKQRDTLRELYDQGDKILREHGNLSYRAIKLIEPECIERWNELGQAHRPLIPISVTLKNHLESVKKAHPQLYDSSKEFFKIIKREQNPWMVAQLYGTFRHWGHPYIDYITGLNKLHKRVTEEIQIDQTYAEALASDLTFLVLKDQFNKRKRWFAKAPDLPKDHAIRQCIETNQWPTPKVVEDFGDNWHKLELLPCFKVPETIDLTDLYSDKAHSMQRSEVLQHIQYRSNTPIPARRVMNTLLTKENPNIPDFLKEINDKGLDDEDLVIGLKAKERELKEEGRYFSLMSWRMRLYFVVTEYLIKKHYVPLFSGLTMADDLTTVTKKLLASTEGQGGLSYDKIYIANSLDYEKWNNRQRLESNSAVFEVMGKFLGYKNIFIRTHEIFEKSLVYYNDRPDLMRVRGNSATCVDPNIKVVWEGQLGGFEGLRQKGWSVLNYLVLRREALTRNTATKFLAQGDNQIVITQYSLMSKGSEESLKEEIRNIWKNNLVIMDRIRRATASLGLIINEDEVVTSAELLVYGKIPVFRGKVLPLETKRWSRISTVTNDQIPSFANAMAGNTTCALAVCQYSDHPMEILKQHHFFGSFCASILSELNPILGPDPLMYNALTKEKKVQFFIRLLYKDPSVGGVCGTNLFRFLISRFPDPVTESLSWWKAVYHHTNNKILKELAIEAGNPYLGARDQERYTKLLENPTSLNIPGGLSCDTLIKEKILEGLQYEASEGNIKNRLVVEAINFTRDYKLGFTNWLLSIKPIFPRFISEFYTSTYFKITESILSVFQNSRTVRKVFSHQFPEKIFHVIYQSELISVKYLQNPRTGDLSDRIWDCSATRADLLRTISWGPDITGITTPHPGEFLKERLCIYGCTDEHVVSRKIPLKFRKPWTRGNMMPYLGSKTKESTSIIQPWEKKLEIPLLQRASELRKVIHWFVDAESNLGRTIYQNIQSLTGLDMSEELGEYRRSGSSKHRLRCSRVSNEGNPGIGFNNLSYVTVTTDGLQDLNRDNFDFMYQSVLIWCGIISTLPENAYCNDETTHFHIIDRSCIRPITEHVLESPRSYVFPDMQNSIKRMLSQEIEYKLIPRLIIPDTCDWEKLSSVHQSWYLGRAQGFLWGTSVFLKKLHEAHEVLFPVSITSKVDPIPYMDGLHRGFCLGATLRPLYTRYGSLSVRARIKYEGEFWYIVEMALACSKLSEMINSSRFAPFLVRTGSDIIKSYPATREETGDVLRRWFLRKLIRDRQSPSSWKSNHVVVFAEMNSEFIIGLFRVAESILPAYRYNQLSDFNVKLLKSATELLSLLNKYNDDTISILELHRLETELRSPYMPDHSIVTSEARHAANFIESSELLVPTVVETKKYRESPGIGGTKILLEFQPSDQETLTESIVFEAPIPKMICPLMSGFRTVQYCTGAHYKYKDIAREFPIVGDGIFCGDGSGGMGANHLRKNPGVKVIFNSLLSLDGPSLRGLAPTGPGAYTQGGLDIQSRCVNFKSCWEEPSDLSNPHTWDRFVTLKDLHKLHINVICCDAEVYDESVTQAIEENILEYLPKFFIEGKGVLIYKTYWNRLQNIKSITHRLKLYFERVCAFLPRTQSSFTSEIYIIGLNFHNPDISCCTEITRESLLMLKSSLRVCSEVQKEFKRALALDYSLSIVGLESNVPYLSIEEIAVLLVSVGLETGLALHYSDVIRVEIGKGLHPFGLMWILGYLVSKRTLPVTSWIKAKPYFPASAQLQRVLAALYGIWFGLVGVTQDLIGFKHLVEMYQGETIISIGATNPIKSKKTDKVLGRFLCWHIGEGVNMKRIDPSPKAAVTQQFVRLFRVLYHNFFKNRQFTHSDIQQVESVLTTISRGLTLNVLRTRTDICFETRGRSHSFDFEPLEHQLQAPSVTDVYDL